MAKKLIPKSEYAGSFFIGDIEVPCAVTESEQRLLTQNGFLKAIGRAQPSSKDLKRSAGQLPFFLNAKALKPFVNSNLTVPGKPVSFITPEGKSALGYDALLLPQTCKIYVEAYQDGVLSNNQEPLAFRCMLALGALAEVGIIALVDEATGYQRVRERNALQVILDRVLNDVPAKWAKRFPDRFWGLLIEIKGYPSYMALSRPSFVGHWVNDIVYSRLGPGVLSRLKEINPRKGTGTRSHKHHSYLTEEGIGELRDLLTIVIHIMEHSKDNDDFMERLNREIPRVNETIPMDFKCR